MAAGASREVTEDLLMTFNIGTVVRGTVTETHGGGDDSTRYKVPRDREMYRCDEQCSHALSEQTVPAGTRVKILKMRHDYLAIILCTQENKESGPLWCV